MAGLSGSLDLDRSEGDSVLVMQRLIGGDRLAIDADQVILRPAVANALSKQLLDGDAFVDVDIVGEAAAIVVDIEDFHELAPTVKETQLVKSEQWKPNLSGRKQPVGNEPVVLGG